MVMASINYPIIDYYWFHKSHIPQIADFMTRDRFYAIRTNLKVVYDADVTAEERKTKIWSLASDRILQGCLMPKR